MGCRRRNAACGNLLAGLASMKADFLFAWRYCKFLRKKSAVIFCAWAASSGRYPC
jgi:hypothetical protein